MVSASTRKGCYISILNIIQGEVDATQVLIFCYRKDSQKFIKNKREKTR